MEMVNQSILIMDGRWMDVSSNKEFLFQDVILESFQLKQLLAFLLSEVDSTVSQQKNKGRTVEKTAVARVGIKFLVEPVLAETSRVNQSDL